MNNLTSKSQCTITTVVLGINMLSGSHLHAATLYWDGITSGNWSDQTNWSTASSATTPNPAADPGALDDAVFNITTANNVNQEVSLNSSNRSANSILINNAGTTFFRRASGGSTAASYLQVGAGGFTMSSTSGAVTLGQDVVSTGQKIGLRAATGNTSLSITNNSSSLLTFNQPTQTRTNSTAIASTITYAGSGSGGILQTGEVGKATASDGSVAVTVNMTGTGVVTFGGANTYTGTTTIKAGTLALDATGTIANSSNIIVGDTGSSGAVLDVSAKTGGFTVGSSQKLSGIGTIDADAVGTFRTVTIEGTHAVGNSPGSQTVEGNLSYASGSIFEWDLASNSVGTAGTDYDAVTVTGNLSIDSAAIFRVMQNAGVDFANSFWSSNQAWNDIFTVAGSTTSGWSNTAVAVYDTSNTPVDVSSFGSFTITGTSLAWSAVPEPTSALAGLLVAAGLLSRRRA